MERLKQVVLSFDRARLIEEDCDYLHFEFRSRVFGFVDDVEFRRRESDKTIDVRSAARTGYWDFGVNRQRVNQIREAFATLPAAPEQSNPI